MQLAFSKWARNYHDVVGAMSVLESMLKRGEMSKQLEYATKLRLIDRKCRQIYKLT